MSTYFYLDKMDEDNLLLLDFLEEERTRQQTRTWVREPLLRRREEGEFHQMAMELNNVDYFYGAYRMTPERFQELMTCGTASNQIGYEL